MEPGLAELGSAHAPRCTRSQPLDCMSSSTNEATHPRCSVEGYPDRPGRASYMEGESWGIIAKLLSESIHRNRVMRWQLPKAAVGARCGTWESSLQPNRARASAAANLW